MNVFHELGLEFFQTGIQGAPCCARLRRRAEVGRELAQTLEIRAVVDTLPADDTTELVELG